MLKGNVRATIIHNRVRINERTLHIADLRLAAINVSFSFLGESGEMFYRPALRFPIYLH